MPIDAYTLNRRVPLTPEELANERERSIAAADLPSTVEFTCDTCGAVSFCTLAFDGYNTDGDCLAEK
jgi:hypothetical protein